MNFLPHSSMLISIISPPCNIISIFINDSSFTLKKQEKKKKTKEVTGENIVYRDIWVGHYRDILDSILQVLLHVVKLSCHKNHKSFSGRL